MNGLRWLLYGSLLNWTVRIVFFHNVSGTEESENQAEEELIAFEGGASELN